MGKGLKLLDLTARSEHTSKLEKGKDKTKFIVGSLASRQMFKIMAKYGNDLADVNSMADCAIQFVRYGLKDVEGELGIGFKLTDDTRLGWKNKAVADDYLDALPLDLITEIAEWVTSMSKVGKDQKKA